MVVFAHFHIPALACLLRAVGCAFWGDIQIVSSTKRVFRYQTAKKWGKRQVDQMRCHARTFADKWYSTSPFVHILRYTYFDTSPFCTWLGFGKKGAHARRVIPVVTWYIKVKYLSAMRVSQKDHERLTKHLIIRFHRTN